MVHGVRPKSYLSWRSAFPADSVIYRRVVSVFKALFIKCRAVVGSPETNVPTWKGLFLECCQSQGELRTLPTHSKKAVSSTAGTFGVDSMVEGCVEGTATSMTVFLGIREQVNHHVAVNSAANTSTNITRRLGGPSLIASIYTGTRDALRSSFLLRYSREDFLRF